MQNIKRESVVAEEMSFEKAVNEVKVKFEIVASELIRRDREKTAAQITAEIKRQGSKKENFIFQRGICEGLKMAQGMLLEEQMR